MSESLKQFGFVVEGLLMVIFFLSIKQLTVLRFGSQCCNQAVLISVSLFTQKSLSISFVHPLSIHLIIMYVLYGTY
jgi:hypothetical protein